MSDCEDLDTSTSEKFIFKPSFVLIAVDTHPLMFVKDENGQTPFMHVLDACSEIAESLLFVSGKNSWNQFGVVFANNNTDKATFIDFKSNLLDTIKLLEKYRRLSREELEKEFKRDGDFNLAYFLLHCTKMFKAIHTDVFKKTLIYITNDHNPVAGDSTKRFTALSKVQSMKDSQITFKLVPMIREFDYNIFYNELFSLISPDRPVDKEVCLDTEGLVEKLSSEIRSRLRKQKSIFYLSKENPAHNLKVEVFKFHSDMKRDVYNNGHMQRSTQTVLYPKSEPNFGAESNPFGAVPIKFGKIPTLKIQKKKLLDIKSSAPHGFHFICVSDRISEPGFIVTESSSLLTIDQKETMTAQFNSLWQYCVDKTKVLICGFKFGSRGKIRHVELIPKFPNNKKMFLIRIIPALNQIHLAPIMKVDDEFTPTQIDATKKLIDELTIPFHPHLLMNMSYNLKARYLRAKLLDEKEDESELEESIKVKDIDDQVKDVVTELLEEFSLNGTGEKKLKRKAPASTASKSKKTKK